MRSWHKPESHHLNDGRKADVDEGSGDGREANRGGDRHSDKGHPSTPMRPAPAILLDDRGRL